MFNVAFIYQPHFKTGCFRVAMHDQKGKNNNYVIVTCSPMYNGVWRYSPDNISKYSHWKNGNIDCICVPIKDCVQVKNLEDITKQYNLEKLEYKEPKSTLIPKVKKVAELLKNSKHCIVFTGAGISTSADIPDFRGPKGVWTKEEKKEKIEYGSDIVETHPTFCHYALTELAKRNYIKFLVTTNMDGLHWRSGFPLHMYEELHGSAYTEHCIHCHKHYQRNEEVIRGSPDHLTDNICDFCHKKLMDTIVNFNDTYRNPLEGNIVEFESNEADLVITLGTSCFVQPAATFPEKVVLSEIANARKKLGKEGNLVLVNLQATPLDEYCSVRCFCETDVFADLLMKELGIDNFERKFDAMKINNIKKIDNNNNKKCIVFL